MNISAGTIARTIALGIALINQVLMVFGYKIIDISDDAIYELVSTIYTVVTAIIAFWKNNSFTTAAIKGDEVMKELKANNKE